MPRRVRHEEVHENHERWLVSYADFITLLFAFFVVMYALSSVNEGKYKVLSDSLVVAFGSLGLAPESSSTIVPPLTPQARIHDAAVPAPVVSSKPPPADDPRQQVVKRLRDMADDIRRVLAPLTEGGQVSIAEGAFGIAVEINASALFSSGDATLGPAAQQTLRAVAQVLAEAEFPVSVEGHTDNTPINTYRFPSNWELSSARASSVVRLFIDAGMKAERLTAVGHADQRPVTGNDTEQGRARNRRVTIMIESRAGEVLPTAPGSIAPDDPIRSILPSDPGAAVTTDATQTPLPAAIQENIAQ